MKRYILTTIITVTAFSCFAQKFNLRPANNLFEKRAYLDAAALYEQAHINDMESMKKIGDCYYFNTEMDKAASWYEKLLTS